MEGTNVPNFAKLDCGCGKWRKSGFVGLDTFEAADHQGLTEEDKYWIINWDLNKSIPYPDNSIEEIYCSHFLEHVIDVDFFLNEIIRVCKPGARAEIYVPIKEMLSVGHITEFTEDWFEDNLGKITEYGFLLIRFKEINRDKPAELRLPDGTKAQRAFDELHIIMEVVK